VSDRWTNGYPYSSIERVFIDRNLLPRNAISPQGIRSREPRGGDITSLAESLQQQSQFNLHTIADISELFRSLDKPPLAKLSFFVGC
jgi:hypothetical protein